MAEFIYFDLGNVLLLFDQQTAIQQVAELTDLSPERTEQLIFASGLQVRYEEGEITSREFYDQFCRNSGTQPAADAFWKATSDIFTQNPGTFPIVRQLSSLGVGLGVLSNTCDSHWQQICSTTMLEIRPLFQQAVLSFEVRSCKPNPAIYREAIRRAGCEPNQIFFVDDREENVVAAQQIGIDAVQFRDVNRLIDDLQGRGVSVEA